MQVNGPPQSAGVLRLKRGGCVSVGLLLAEPPITAKLAAIQSGRLVLPKRPLMSLSLGVSPIARGEAVELQSFGILRRALSTRKVRQLTYVPYSH